MTKLSLGVVLVVIKFCFIWLNLLLHVSFWFNLDAGCVWLIFDIVVFLTNIWYGWCFITVCVLLHFGKVCGCLISGTVCVLTKFFSQIVFN